MPYKREHKQRETPAFSPPAGQGKTVAQRAGDECREVPRRAGTAQGTPGGFDGGTEAVRARSRRQNLLARPLRIQGLIFSTPSHVAGVDVTPGGQRPANPGRVLLHPYVHAYGAMPPNPHAEGWPPSALLPLTTTRATWCTSQKRVFGCYKQTLFIHWLVQIVLRDAMSEEERSLWLERAMLVIHAVFPSGEHGTWPLCEPLLPHTLTCAEWTLVLRQKKLEGARLLNNTGRYLYERA